MIMKSMWKLLGTVWKELCYYHVAYELQPYANGSDEIECLVEWWNESNFKWEKNAYKTMMAAKAKGER